MKKPLAMALGAMLVAGSAVPASAASQIDFKGYYRAYYMIDNNYERYSGDARYTDHYFGHRLNFDLTFTPTDEISVTWRFRGPGFKRWGESSGSWNGEDGSQLHTKFVYGTIKQDWGTIYVGRLNGGDDYGLASLGYLPASVDNEWTQIAPFDGGDDVDSIMYTNQWDNGFGLLVQYAKLDSDGYEGMHYIDSDKDADMFVVEPKYQWETGGVSLALSYLRDANYADNLNYPSVINSEAVYNAWFVNPAFMQSWGAFSVHAEAKFGWGTWNDALDSRWTPGTNYLTEDADLEGIGFYVDVDYNYGPGNVTLAGWWTQGNNLDSGNAWDRSTTNKALVDMGADFYPLLIAYNQGAAGFGRFNDAGHFGAPDNRNAVSVANNPLNFVGAAAFGSVGPLATGVVDYTRTSAFNNAEANHWAIAVTGEHAFTDEIAMHYAVAYLGLNKPNYSVIEGGLLNNAGEMYMPFYADQKKDMGWELDLGFEFKLLDNLTFTTTVGYMINGDAYKTLTGYQTFGDMATGVWEDADDTFSWYNTLQFDF